MGRRSKKKGKSSNGAEIGGSSNSKVKSSGAEICGSSNSKVKSGDEISYYRPIDPMNDEDKMIMKANYEDALRGGIRLRKLDEPSKDWTVKKEFLDKPLNLSSSEEMMVFYSCFSTYSGGFVIRSVKFQELIRFGRNFIMHMEYESKDHDPNFEVELYRCVVHDSQIVFGMLSSWQPKSRLWKKMPPELPHKRTFCPLMVDLDGKLHALLLDQDHTSFHVLDRNKNEWLVLPKPPDLGYCEQVIRPVICPAVVGGTKLLLFVNGIWDRYLRRRKRERGRRVFCFDYSKGGEWRELSAPGFLFTLPLFHHNHHTRALVLNESNMNIMFLFDRETYRIGVHTVELEDDDDVIKLIGYFELPQSDKYTLPATGEFIHVGARKVCFVGNEVYVPDNYLTCLMVIPFEFDIHISEDKQVKSFTIKFMPHRYSEPYSLEYFGAGNGSFLL